MCRTGELIVVHGHGPHHGEEPPLSGWAGSGTIFFSWCNLRCVYCQNWEISWKGVGREVDAAELATMMLELQERGCHNVNLVSPSHAVAQVLEAVWIAARQGLRLPLVYNTGGYDSPETLELLDGVFDIYMPDCKYADGEIAFKLSGVRDYWERNRAAVNEMHRQVGDLKLDERGVAYRGLLARHLVLPNDYAGTARVMEFLASLSRDTYVNVMAQYHPCFKASRYPEINRRPTIEELRAAVQAARDAGLHRGGF